MLRRSIQAGALCVLASLAAADGPSLPLLFHPAEAVDGFVARAPGLAARFVAGGFDLDADGAAVAVRFEGRSVAPRGDAPSATRVHRLTGSDAVATRLRAHERLVYEDVWDGVDVAVHASTGRLEFDLVWSPGADPEGGVVRITGSGPLSLDATGALVVPTASGPLFLAAPISWEVREDGAPLERASRFELVGADRVRIAVDGWSGARPLVVDPVLVWSRYVGGSAGDEATAVAVGPDGATFVTGWTRSGDFPVTADAHDTRRQSEEGFLSKLAPDGRTLEWVTYFGGRDTDRGLGVVVDPATGEPVVVGRTQSSDFPTTAGAFRRVRNGVRDGFVARFAADGASLRWSTYLGGSGGEEVVDAALLADGRVAVCGTTTSSDLPTTIGALQGSSGGRDDAFYALLAADGGSLLASSYLGGQRDEVASGLALDGDHVWLVGTTRSSDFPVTAGAHDVTRADHDGFVARLGTDARDLDFATFLGGSDRDEIRDVARFSFLGAVVVGVTRSSDFPVTDDAFQVERGGLEDGFLALVNWNGSQVLHATYVGGDADDVLEAVAVDEHETVWVAGGSASTDLAMTGDAPQGAMAGAGDAFLARYDPRTGERSFATFLGGDAEDRALGVAVDPVGGSTHVAGYARAGLPAVADGTPGEPAGARDVFVARVSHGPCGVLAAVEDLGGGCGMTLVGTPARLGREMSLGLEGAPAGSLGLLLASSPTDTPMVLADGCLAMLDVNRTWLLGTFQADATGAFERTVQVNDDEATCGREVVVQALVLAPGQGPSGFGWLSNAQRFVLGD